MMQMSYKQKAQSISVSLPCSAEANRPRIRDLSVEILESLKAKESKGQALFSLSKHEIHPDFRGKMVDWIFEVMFKIGSPLQTFFMSVQLMDRYFKQAVVSLKREDLHRIGVCSMFLASKYLDVCPLRLIVLYEKVSHRRIALETLRETEKEILRTLHFDIEAPLCIEFAWILCDIREIPSVVKKVAEIILVIMQIYYNKQIGPSVEALCALVVAALSANRTDLVPGLLQTLDLQFSDVEAIANEMYQCVLKFSTAMPNNRALNKCLKFEFVGEDKEIRLEFEDLVLQQELDNLILNIA